MSKATEWRKANPERAREISRASYAKRKAEGKLTPSVESNRKRRLERPNETLYRNIKNGRAKQRNIPFDIEPEDIVVPEFCPILGVKLVLDQLRHIHGPSVDRVIPSLGYVKGNVRVISMRANRLKSDASIEELEAIIAYMKAHLGLQ